jgi:uncharacterized membrane protein
MEFLKAFREFMDVVGTAVDGVGVLLVVLGMGLASWRFLAGTQQVAGRSYVVYRQDVGRAILLGLEFLVAGDIIRTVVVDPTLNNVLVLGVIVVIRTFLSMALQLELRGRWPWQGGEEAGSHPSIPGMKERKAT